jgi:hypothetical protein
MNKTAEDQKIFIDGDGVYWLGPDRKYSLAPAAIAHILQGDITERIVRNNDGKFSRTEKILKGGLHTATGWIDLKSSWPDLVHGARFLPQEHERWYFARELHNGVILLKIPEELFQGKAAKLTRFSDVYYKSGFLWKTLFPSSLGDQEVIEIIDEALCNIDTEESSDEILIGYARLAKSSTAMKVRIQLTGTSINSAFPTWAQPNTGNNGKPYTHFDSISFLIAESTEFFDEWDAYQNAEEASTLKIGDLRYQDVLDFTPSIMLERKGGKGNGHIKWRKRLAQYATSASTEDIDKIVKYCTDPVTMKDPYGFLLSFFSHAYATWSVKKDWRNLLSIYQNLCDGLFILEEYDRANGTNHAELCALGFLDAKFNRSGGLELWESRRFINCIFAYAVRRNEPGFSWKLLAGMATSPTRVATYYHFDLNVFCHHDLAVIGVTDPEVDVNLPHFYRFVANAMGPSYFHFWSLKEREKLARAAQQSYCANSNVLLPMCIGYARADELRCFASLFSELETSLLSDLSGFDAKALELILHDYHRLCIEAQHRIVVDNVAVLKDGQNLAFDPRPGSDYWLYMKAKHERMFLGFCLHIFVDSYKKICDAAGRADMSEEAEQKMANFYRQKMPLPKQIPSYIKSWQQERTSEPHDIARLIDVMFSANNGLPATP